MIEIERKFLVRSNQYKDLASSVLHIQQGFLNTDPNRTIRVRIKGNTGFLTIKGISNEEGTTRFEWEKEILYTDALALLTLCEKTVINKTRYEVINGDHIFEVDEFHDMNAGLVIAEIELNRADEFFEKPSWLGKEVTGEIRYYNSQLSKQPFKNWKTT